MLADLSSSAGRPLVIRLVNGTYPLLHQGHNRSLQASLVPAVNLSSVPVSDLTIMGEDGGAILEASGIGTPILVLTERSPPLTLRNLVVRGQVRVEGGQLLVEFCRFEGSRAEAGAALDIRSGMVFATSSDFVDNVAQLGGAARLLGGSAEFSSCRFQRNTALEPNGGGAFHVRRGRVVLRQGCVLRDNWVGSEAASVWVGMGAEVEYWLPAPLGFWVETLGRDHAKFGGGAIRELPYACAAGMKGGSDEISSQSTALCDGYCDEGFFCGPATVSPTGCPAAAFCPAGASAPRPCRAGTYRSQMGGKSQADCTQTEPGFFSPTQSEQQTECNAGSYTDETGQGSCALCPSGRFQSGRGRSSCILCDQGYICPNGSAVQLPATCNMGSYLPDGVTFRTDRDCAECPPGRACYGGRSQPANCSAGTFARDVRQSACRKCRAGTFQAEEGATSCDGCPPGRFCSAGAAVALPCPAGTTMRLNFTMTSAEDCELCPAGVSRPSRISGQTKVKCPGAGVLACPPHPASGGASLTLPIKPLLTRRVLVPLWRQRTLPQGLLQRERGLRQPACLSALPNPCDDQRAGLHKLTRLHLRARILQQLVGCCQLPPMPLWDRLCRRLHHPSHTAPPAWLLPAGPRLGGRQALPGRVEWRAIGLHGRKHLRLQAHAGRALLRPLRPQRHGRRVLRGSCARQSRAL